MEVYTCDSVSYVTVTRILSQSCFFDARFGSQAPFAFPTNNSQDDIAALKAIAEANPLNSDLQNFISSKDYLKDRTQSDGYNVGVTWNAESPSRVKSFFIKDYRTHTVSDMKDIGSLSGYG